MEAGRCPWRNLTLSLGIALAALMVLSVSSAHAFVYWTDSGADVVRPTDDAVGRANLDGSALDPNFIQPAGTGGLAVDGAHIYWGGEGAIGRANLDGSGAQQSFIPTGTGAVANGVAVNGSQIFWTNPAAETIFVGIGRANLDGSGVETGFITTNRSPMGVAVSDTHVYWTGDPDSIGRANLDGTGVQQRFIALPFTADPRGIAVFGDKLYWANAGDGTIGRANLDGSSVEPSFITTGGSIRGLAVDGTNIYWSSTSAGGRIGRANLDGTGVESDFITSIAPWGLAVDALTGPDCSKLEKKVAKAKKKLKKADSPKAKAKAKAKLKKAEKRLKACLG
jgi:hypothetical protein